MRDDMAGVESESTGATWEVVGAWVREGAQALIQGILEEEVTELLGSEKSERKRGVDAAAGDELGDDHGEASEGSGTRGAVREPGAAAVFAEDERGGRAAPGAVPARSGEGDFELAMRGLLGEGAPLSKSSIRRLRGAGRRSSEGGRGGRLRTARSCTCGWTGST